MKSVGGADRVEPVTFSVADAARYLGVSVETMRWWLKQGRFARVRIGRRVLIPRADLDRYVKEHQEPKRTG